MEAYKREFIEFLQSAGVLKFGDFTAKSGRKIPYFVNAGMIKTGDQISKLGEFYAKAYFDKLGKKEAVLYGPAYKGIPLSISAAVALSKNGLDVPFFFNRKEAKDHGGDAGLLLGSSIKEGDKIVIIEDVTTSGKSIEETFPIIKAQCPNPDKIEIKGLMVSLNRQEKGKGEKSALEEITDLYGFPANAIVTMSEVVEYLYNKPTGKDGKIIIDDKIKTDIENYYKEYGAK